MIDQKSKSKKSFIKILIAFLLIVPTKNSFSEDINYLQDEIKENQRKQKIIQDDFERMQNFLNNYDSMRESLSRAYHELYELEAKIRSLLQKNLIKSTIKLGFETYSKAEFAMDLAEKSVKEIIVACITEYAGDKFQDSLDSPYTVSVKGLSEQARKIAPELEEVQKILRMDSIDIKIKVMREGEDPEELGETGLIYRKFYYLLEAIEKAKKQLYELRKNLDKTKDDIKGNIDNVKSQKENLDKRAEDLNKRLNQAIAESGKKYLEEINSEVENKTAINVRVSYVSNNPSALQQYQDALFKLAAKAKKELDEYTNNEELKSNFLDHIIFSPLEKFEKPATEKDLASMSIPQIRNSIEDTKSSIGFNTKRLEIAKKYSEKVSLLLSSFKDSAQGLISSIISAGGKMDNPAILDAKNTMKAIAKRMIDLEDETKILSQRIDILKKNLEKLENENQNRIAEISAFASEFSSEFPNVINAFVYANKKAKEAVDMAEAYGLVSNMPSYGAGAFKIASSSKLLEPLQKETSKMFAEGKTAKEVKEFLNKKLQEFVNIYELSAKAGHLKLLARNTREYFEDKYLKDPKYQLLKYANNDPSKDYEKQMLEIDWQSQPNTLMILHNKCENIENLTFSVGDKIRDFLDLIPKIEDVDKKIKNLFETEKYDIALNKMNDIMSSLDQDKNILSSWLEVYPPPNKGFKILSKETLNSIEKARAKFNEENEQENKESKEQENFLKTIKEFYLKFKQAYESRNGSLVMSFIDDNWQAEGTTLSDLEENLNRIFKTFDEIKFNIQNLNIQSISENKCQVSYDVTITSRIYKRNLKHEEKSSVVEELIIDKSGKVKIFRTLSGRFWYID